MGSKNQKRKTTDKSETTVLPTGLKVVPAPKNTTRRKLLSGPDISTSGGYRSVHSQSVSLLDFAYFALKQTSKRRQQIHSRRRCDAEVTSIETSKSV